MTGLKAIVVTDSDGVVVIKGAPLVVTCKRPLYA